MSEVKPKSRRGRKPRVKDEIDKKPIPMKKRGRKKKCEMNLGCVPKISGYNPNGESIDTEDNKVKFGNNEYNDEEYENVSFGLLKLKRHNISKKQVSVVNNNGSFTNKECIINFNWVVDNMTDINMTGFDTKKEKKEHNLSNFFDVKPQEKIINYSKNSKKMSIKSVIDNKNNKIHGRDIKYIKILGCYGGKTTQIPTKTNILCWWCCHSFDTIPRFIPTRYDQIRNRFKVTGNFCSWSCARSYFINEHRFSGKSTNILLSSLIRVIHGRSYNINSAPPRSALKAFGGKMTIDEFRNLDKNVYFEINSNRITMDESYYIRELNR